MHLQTLSGKPVSSENASAPKNFRPYSPQTAAESRLQPDTAGEHFALTHRTKASSPTPQAKAIMVEVVRHVPSPAAQAQAPKMAARASLIRWAASGSRLPSSRRYMSRRSSTITELTLLSRPK